MVLNTPPDFQKVVKLYSLATREHVILVNVETETNKLKEIIMKTAQLNSIKLLAYQARRKNGLEMIRIYSGRTLTGLNMVSLLVS